MSGVLVVLVAVWALIGTFLALLPDAPGSIFGGDYGHVTVAAVLAFGIVVAFPVLRKRFGSFLLLGGAIFGLAIEFAQKAQGSGRNFEVIDVVGDVLGVGIGLGFAALLDRYRSGRRRPVAALVLLVATLLAIAGPVRASAPVDRWASCLSGRSDPGAVVRTLVSNDAGAKFQRAGTAIATEFGRSRSTDRHAADLVKEIRCRDAFMITVTVKPANVSQTGPSRLVSISEGTKESQQNLMVGVVEDDIVVRLRVRPHTFDSFTAGNVLRAGIASVVVVRFGNGVLSVTVDGSERLRENADRSTLSNWSTGYPLNVGNELTDDRLFDGKITDVRVETRASF